MARTLGCVAAVACLALAACAGDLVVRAPQEWTPQPGGPLAAIAPLRIAVSIAAEGVPADAPVGERAAGWGRPAAPIVLTERPVDVVRRVVVQELREAGHEMVDEGADVTVSVALRDFGIDAPRAGSGWDVVAHLEVALRVARVAGSADWSEFVYSAERTGHSLLPPGIGFTERILGELVSDLGALVAEREALATALERRARPRG